MASNDNDDLRESTLSPEVRRIRNSIIKKFAHEPLDIMAKFVKDVVENEEDTVKRLGAMAARVEILRMRISQISESGSNLTVDDFTETETEEHKLEEDSSEIVITSPNLSDWVRLRIIENSEINGVRFPKGVVIDVSQEDGDRLLDSGKASYVDEDEIKDVKSELDLKKSKQKNLKETEESSAVKSEEADESSDVAEDSPQSAGQSEETLNEIEADATVKSEEVDESSDVAEDSPQSAEQSEETFNEIEADATVKSEEVDESSDVAEDSPQSAEQSEEILNEVEEVSINLGEESHKNAADNKKLNKPKKKIKDTKSVKLDDDDQLETSEENGMNLSTKNKEEKESADDMLAGFDLEDDPQKK